MEQENEKAAIDSWDDFVSGNFLKASDVNSQEDAYVCVDVEATTDGYDESSKPKIRLHLQRNEKESVFDLNKTNAKKVKELGIASPKAIVGKKIFFKKALVRNPTTNLEVESLRIFKVE